MFSPFDHPIVAAWKWWIAGAIYAVCAAAFLRDINDLDLIPYGICYLPMVGTAVFYRDGRMIWGLAALASVMVVAGYFLPQITEDPMLSAINRGGSIVAIFVTAALLSHTRRQQEALARQTLRAERGDQAKARLLTNLSRELVTPLNSIIGFSEMLREDCRDDQREFVDYILAGGRGLLNTFRNLIDVTAAERRHLQAVPIDLRALLEKVVRSAMVEAAQHRVSLALAPIDELLPDVLGDPWALRRILENLLNNAIKFSNPEGQVQVALVQEGERIAAVVHDHGVGMAPDVLARLGELFFQAGTGGSRKFEGMGAGLALSLQLAEAMRGTLRFESAPGRGTTVRLSLPAAREADVRLKNLAGLRATPG